MGRYIMQNSNYNKTITVLLSEKGDFLRQKLLLESDKTISHDWKKKTVYQE